MVRDSSILGSEASLPSHAILPVIAHKRSAPSTRIHAVDALRGLAIVLMVLDHTRDFFFAGPQPTDLTRTNGALFFTRFITHFCAPTFVFLAGTSAFFVGQRSTPAELRRYLRTRGGWLILVELTVVHLVWNFNLTYSNGIVLQVIWAIGVSMCVLSLLVGLPRVLQLAIGLGMVGGHNLLDAVRPEQLGPLAGLWRVLHVQGPIPVGFVHYPLIPWIGVMLLGYCAGELFAVTGAQRRRALGALGAGACLLFVLLRLSNGYGDPKPWSTQPSALFTLLSFLNVSKYPPSLDYLLVTLGPALLFLAWLDARPAAGLHVLRVFGQVPLFAYVLHIALVHLLAGLTALSLGYGSVVLTNFFLNKPQGWGFGLAGIYVVWLLCLWLLFAACRWRAAYKRSEQPWWRSYC